MKILNGLIVVALLAVAVSFGLARGADQANRLQGLYADSLEAARDTTRQVTLERGIIADSLQLLQLRVVQTEQQADALDRALKQERKLKGELQVQIASLSATGATVQRVDTADTRVMQFGPLYERPYTVDSLLVVSPRPPALARMWLYLTLDPMPLAFRVGCGQPDPARHGIRSATMNVLAPKWAKVQIAGVQQDPDLCNPKKASSTRSTVTKLAIGATLGEVIRRVIKGWLE